MIWSAQVSISKSDFSFRSALLVPPIIFQVQFCLNLSVYPAIQCSDTGVELNPWLQSQLQDHSAFSHATVGFEPLRRRGRCERLTVLRSTAVPGSVRRWIITSSVYKIRVSGSANWSIILQQHKTRGIGSQGAWKQIIAVFQGLCSRAESLDYFGGKKAK